MNTILKISALSGFVIALLGSILVSTVFAHTTPNFMPYGEMGQEDELYYYHDGVLYINAVLSQGNGMFIAEPDIDDDYSIDQAIERFGINEDVQVFNVKPSIYSDVTIMYELDDDLQFQMTYIYQDSESGITNEVQQMENNSD